ncbi:MAG: Cdc6-like AAA superfamily ATPase [Psychroserpens sp.]|jgi:Cdc6-like AAA superfamily ATPase
MIQKELTSQYKLNSIFIIHGKANGKDRQGTCFALNENEVMTAWHVVNSMEDIKVSFTSDDFAQDKYCQLHLIEHDEELDIAILSVESPPISDFIDATSTNTSLNLPIQVCGYPLEKGGKHAIMDTTISNLYDCIKTENYSFEIKQIDTVNNYKGMSGSPILSNGCVIGVLLVQQGGTSLYCISIADIFSKKESIKQYFKIAQPGQAKHILFNHYTKESEPFYCERYQDLEFEKSLNINNLWVFGKSGVGKTAIINRNLTINENEYCYCDLSPIVVESEYDVLSEILECVEDKLEGERPLSEKNIIKQITCVLRESKTSKIVVVIDELGVDDEELLKKIAEALMRLVSYVTHNYKEDGLMFAVSTIGNPKRLLQNAGKANDYFQFLCCDSWDESLSELFDLICSNLQININFMKSEIIAKAEQSPRILKSIIKNIISLEVITKETIDIAISKSMNEAVL